MKKVFKSLFLGLLAVGMAFTGCKLEEESGNLGLLALVGSGSGGKTIKGICFSEDCGLNRNATKKSVAQELVVGKTYPVELVYTYSDGSIGKEPIDLDDFIDNDEFEIVVRSSGTDYISVKDDTDLYVKAATSSPVRVRITLGKHEATYWFTAAEAAVPVLSKIEVVKTAYTLYEDSAESERTFTVSAINTDGSSVDVTSDSKTSVTSDNEKVATASKGVITVNGLGSAKLTVTYEGQKAYITVTVLDEDDEVTSIKIKNSTTSVISYHSLVTLNTEAVYESGKKSELDKSDVAYTITSGSSYAALEKGVLTNNNTSGSEQNVGVTATYMDSKSGKSFTDTVTFKFAAQDNKPYIELSTDSVEIQKGETESFTVKYYTGASDKTGTDVTSNADVKSSDTSVATVSKGTITGVAAGKAKITVTYNELSEEIAVQVTTGGEVTLPIGFDFN